MITLYKKDSKGKIRQWSIQVVCKVDEKNEYGIKTSDGLYGGNIKDPIYKEGIPNNLFKTSRDKAQAMMESAIAKKLRSNYFHSIDEIKDEDILFMPTGCPSGMIWEEWKDKPHVIYPALASGKLDGSKLYSTWREDRVFLNTRSAKEHKNFRHIEEALSKLYEENPRIVLDGEAYNHDYRERFEELQSIFRKEDPTTEERALSAEVAKFYIYDAVDLDNPTAIALERQELLIYLYNKYLKEYNCIVLWKSYLMMDEEQYNHFHLNCMDEEFEGTVLKISNAPYVQRKNKMVMKGVFHFTHEREEVGIVEGTGTHKGIAANVTISLIVVDGMNEYHEDAIFTAIEEHGQSRVQDCGMAKGWNHDMLKEMLENREHYIGKMATIEYGGITTYGKLRFPKFKSLRLD